MFQTSPYLFAQTPALNELLKERADSIRATEQTSDHMARLNEEKRFLLNKLLDVNKQYDEAMKTQTKKRDIAPIPISANEIAEYIEGKRIGRCRFTPGKNPGEYIIQKDKIKIRFTFLPKESPLAPKLSIIKGEYNEDVYQIEQPGYNPNSTNQKGLVDSIMRFRINQNNSPGDVIHAAFHGQSLNDTWFGQKSSYTIIPLTCELGS